MRNLFDLIGFVLFSGGPLAIVGVMTLLVVLGVVGLAWAARR